MKLSITETQVSVYLDEGDKKDMERQFGEDCRFRIVPDFENSAIVLKPAKPNDGYRGPGRSIGQNNQGQGDCPWRIQFDRESVPGFRYVRTETVNPQYDNGLITFDLPKRPEKKQMDLQLSNGIDQRALTSARKTINAALSTYPDKVTIEIVDNQIELNMIEVKKL